MGSPNSQTEDGKGVTFDSKSLLEFLTGKLKVPSGAISTEEWLEIIKFVVNRCKAFLKYLPGFHPLSSVFYTNLSQTNPKLVIFPEGITSRTKCLDLGFIYRGAESFFGSPVCEEKLLLSQNGDFLHWEYVFHRCRSDDISETEIMQKCVFVRLNETALLNLFRQFDPLLISPLNIIYALWIAARQGVKERRLRLEAMRNLTDDLGAIKDRISTSSG